jgi:hypothetical protein
MPSVIDTLKSALAGAKADTQIRIQMGADGSVFQVTAAELAQALGVQSPAAPTSTSSTSTTGTNKVRVTTDALRIRAQPSTSAAVMGQYTHGDVFEIVQSGSMKADNYTWYKTADGRGWIAAEFTEPADASTTTSASGGSFPPPPPAAGTGPAGSGVTVLTPGNAGTSSSGGAASGWAPPFHAAMRGVGSSAGGWAPEAQHVDICKRNNIEVVLVVAYEPGQAAKTIQPLRAVGVKHFILRAAIHEAVSTPQRFVEITAPILKEYAQAIGNTNDLLIAIHNEVNLVQEGWTKAWKDGAEFANWWQAVAGSYRQLFPDAKMGFPALSPGGDVPNIRLNEETFIRQATAAVDAADWIGVHYYWVNRDGSDINPAMTKWRSWFGKKPIIGTEVGPADANTVTPDAVRLAYQKFAEIGIPAMAWLLTGAGAWQNAAWDLHGIIL